MVKDSRKDTFSSERLRITKASKREMLEMKCFFRTSSVIFRELPKNRMHF